MEKKPRIAGPSNNRWLYSPASAASPPAARERNAAGAQIENAGLDVSEPHSHDHEHVVHSHGVSADADAGKLTAALALIVGFMVVDVVVGTLVHSLALLSDAAQARAVGPGDGRR